MKTGFCQMSNHFDGAAVDHSEQICHVDKLASGGRGQGFQNYVNDVNDRISAGFARSKPPQIVM
jgi:hypothetical protein